MSIKNRYHLIQQVLDNHHLIQRKRWNLVLFRFDDEPISYLEYYASTLSINFLKRDFMIDHIYIYHYATQKNISAYKKMIDQFDIKIVQLPLSLPRNTIRFVIMKKFLMEQKNTIFLGKNRVYINNQNSNSFDINESLVLSAIVPKVDLNDQYRLITQQNNLIVDSDLLIVASSVQASRMINYALNISKQLGNNDYETTNISLTISNQKFNLVQDVSLAIDVGTILSLNSKIDLAKLKEIYAYNREIIHHFSLPKTIKSIDYLLDNYLYYPYFDRDARVEWLPNLNVINQNSIDEYTKHPYSFNTNGFQHIDMDPHIMYQNIYTRFNDKMSGLFVEKPSHQGNISKIIHHLWLDDLPINKYTDAWKKILTDSWKYLIWTKDKIESDILPNSRWSSIYQNANEELKNIIYSMAILELYGGIVVDSHLLPMRQFPSELLQNHFFVSFTNEKTHGKKISFSVIGSNIGTTDYKINPSIKKNPKVVHPKNYVFNVTSSNQDHIILNNETVFDDIYKTLSNTNHLDTLENILLTNRNVTIYPSYYFNPSIRFHPEHVINMALCTRMRQNPKRVTREKSGIKRSYCITAQSILSKLEENPKDKFKNIKTIEKIDINNDYVVNNHSLTTTHYGESITTN